MTVSDSRTDRGRRIVQRGRPILSSAGPWSEQSERDRGGRHLDRVGGPCSSSWRSSSSVRRPEVWGCSSGSRLLQNKAAPRQADRLRWAPPRSRSAHRSRPVAPQTGPTRWRLPREHSIGGPTWRSKLSTRTDPCSAPHPAGACSPPERILPSANRSSVTRFRPRLGAPALQCLSRAGTRFPSN